MCDVLEEKKESIEDTESEAPSIEVEEVEKNEVGESGQNIEEEIPEPAAEAPVVPRDQTLGLLLDKAFQRLEDKIEKNDFSEINLRLSDDVKILLQNFYKKVVDRLEDPKGVYAYKLQASFFKGLIGIYDLLKELENAWPPEGDSIHAKNYKTVGTQLLQVFLMHDIIPVSPHPGEAFNPLLHRAVGIEEASTPEENEMISECTRTGFAFHEVVIRPAEVKIKKYLEKTEVDGEEESDLPETNLEQKKEEND